MDTETVGNQFTTLDLWIALATAVFLIVVVGLRTYTDGKIEVKLADAMVAVIAAGLMLFMSGRITKFNVTPTSVSVEGPAGRAILSAAAQPIAGQVSTVPATALPISAMDVALKGGVNEIPNMVRREVPALEFLLGGAVTYAPDAIKQYLETLAQYPFFRFVVILNKDKSLFGMIDGRKMLGILQNPQSSFRFDTFARALTQGGPADQEALAKLPGFVPASAAVTRANDKRDTLERMEARGIDWLPVVSDKREFQGVVERSRVTASLILDVTNQLRKAPAPPAPSK
jgi:hypothetical protein